MLRPEAGLTGSVDPARSERLALCDLFDELGPEGATVLEGWGTAELAAHLLTRDTRLDAVPGMALAFAHPWTLRVERGVKEALAYDEIVRRLRRGPPALSLGRLGGWRADLHEWFVHHEDVRRAGGLGPRPDGADQRRLDDAVWSILPVFGPLLAWPVRATVVLVSEDGRRRRVRRGADPVEVHGRPSELLLALFGRSGAAVEAIGDPGAVLAWTSRPGVAGPA
ncbi:MAG: TIGR03085 family metal-binding protein [Acidimicrobiales bacterium]